MRPAAEYRMYRGTFARYTVSACRPSTLLAAYRAAIRAMYLACRAGVR